MEEALERIAARSGMTGLGDSSDVLPVDHRLHLELDKKGNGQGGKYMQSGVGLMASARKRFCPVGI